MKSSTKPLRSIVCGALLLLLAGSASAQTTALSPAAPAASTTSPAAGGKLLHRSKASLTQTPSKADLKPSGPVTISARSAELVQGRSAIYTGDVVLNSNTLKLDGDKVELMQFPGGDYSAKVTGGPAHVNHAGEGPDNPPLAARAKTLNYDSKTGILDMIGDAYALRGTDQITGETIRYVVKEHRILAAGGEGGGRVTVTIQPRDDATAPSPETAPPPAAPAEKTP
ncbi:MAG: hypothetical protein NVS9B10_23880 [Nevskia sp.]